MTYFTIRLSQFSTLIPLIVGLLYFRKLNTSFRVLFYFIIFSACMEYVAVWYQLYVSPNNLPPLHLFTLVEYAALTYIFCSQLFSRIKYLFPLVLVIGIILALLNAFVWGSLNEMNHIFHTFECAVLVIFSLSFFGNSLSPDNLQTPIFKQPMFWLSTGTLLYFSVNLLFFMLFNKLLLEGIQNFSMGQTLHSITNILTNLLFAQSLRCFRKE